MTVAYVRFSYAVFTQLGGLELILGLILQGSLPKILENQACLITAECLRNEPRVQLRGEQLGALGVMGTIAKSKDEKNRRILY